MFKRSIIKKFMLLYLAVGISSLSLIGFYSYYKAKQALTQRAVEQLNSVKSLKKIQVEAYLTACISQNRIPDSTVINEIMLDTVHTDGLGNSGEVYLVGSDFKLKSKSRFFPRLNVPIEARTQSVSIAFARGSGTNIAPDYRNILSLSSFSKLAVANLNWVIVAEIDYREAMIPISNLRNDLIFVSIIVLVLIFSIAQVLSNDIVTPILKFKNSAVLIGKGDFNAKVDINSENEFGVLATAFNQMIDDIQKNTAELVAERTKRISALYDGQEFERHRISRDLHDGLAQQLIAIKMTLENLISRKELADENKINELKFQVNSSIDELRKISYNLAPAGLLDFSLEIALENLCRQIQKNTEIQIEFSAYGEFAYLDERTKIYLYRIVQEALNNAIKHAEATQIHVQLTDTQPNLVLMIEDNGKGFDYNSGNFGLGKGLFNMHERSVLLNGTFDVETFPGEGTTIRLKVNKIRKHG